MLKKIFTVLVFIIIFLIMFVNAFVPKNRIAVMDKSPEDKMIFIPSEIEINDALIQIESYLNTVKDDNEASNIIKNINKYCVQVKGIEENGRKILEFNFLPEKYATHSDFKKYFITVKDGGYNYWRISYNLNERKCFNLFINGRG